jgi:ketosteroid isomerase-like protein
MALSSRFGCAAAALLLAACVSAPAPAPDGALEQLFAAERSFARASTERGIRASFLEYFASDGVNFAPGPGSMRERLLARPAPADPLALLLDWSPRVGAVAHSDDLGYTTGPYSLRNQRDASAPTHYGYFFSIWKRENGAWRVAVDAGVSTPAAPEPEGRGAAAGEPSSAHAPRMALANGRERGKDALLALEREPRSLDPEPTDPASYFDLLASSVRVLRDGSYAVLGADAARKALAAPMRRVQWTPSGTGIAASDDFGYTYGRYERWNGGADESSGYYVHVWQRDETGAWRITVDVWLPPE